jgi:hypothetical protein
MSNIHGVRAVLDRAPQARARESNSARRDRTAFQRQVWTALLIPSGERTYRDRCSGGPTDGNAWPEPSANRVAVVIPCHRVVRWRRVGGLRGWSGRRNFSLRKRADDTGRSRKRAHLTRVQTARTVGMSKLVQHNESRCVRDPPAMFVPCIVPSSLLLSRADRRRQRRARSRGRDGATYSWSKLCWRGMTITIRTRRPDSDAEVAGDRVEVRATKIVRSRGSVRRVVDARVRRGRHDLYALRPTVVVP